MKHLALSILAILAFLPFCLSAQPDGQQADVLFFPPRISASAANNSTSSGLGMFVSSMPRHLFPVPALFFEEANSTAIPHSYQTLYSAGQTNTYTDTSAVYVWHDPLRKYYQLLNIVGYRMRTFPETTIELEGGYSDEPGESTTVAIKRAHVVREYLMNIWEIDSGRIAIREPQRMCDSNASRFQRDDARVVLFHTASQELFSLVRYRSIRRWISYLYMHITIDPWMYPEEIASIEVEVMFGDSLLSRSTLEGHPEAERYKLNGMWFVPPQISNTQNGPLRFTATVQTKNGEHRTSNVVSLPVLIENNPNAKVAGATSISIPSFAYRDTSLSTYQTAWVDEVLEQCTHVKIVGSNERDELKDKSQQWRRQDRPNYEKLGRLEEEDMTMYDVSTGVKNNICVYYHNSSPLDDCSVMGYSPQTDTVLAQRRAETMERYINDRNPGIVTKVIGAVEDNWQQYMPLPEERCYARSVTLQVWPRLTAE